MDGSPGRTFEFGRYRLDVDERLLVRGDETIRLTPKAFDTLVVLVRHSGHLISKDDLIQALWPDAHVEENNLAQYISLLRHTLADGPGGGAYIETVPRSGYRFVAAVRKTNGTRPEAAEAPPAPVAPVAAPGVKPRQPARRVLLRAAVAVASLAALIPLRWVGHRPLDIAPLLVLPFEVDSPDAAASGVTMTLAADLVERLSRSGHQRVLPIASVYRFIGAAAPTAPQEAGRELHAAAVLSGRIETDGVKRATRIGARLTRVADGRQLWSETVDVPNGSIRAIEDRLAAAASAALDWPHPTSDTAAAAAGPSFEADEAYVMGRYLWNTRSPEDLFRSIALLEHAVALAPAEARFHAALADAYAFDVGRWPRGELEARAALERDRTLGAPHATLGFIRLFWQRDSKTAEDEFKTAIKLEPGYATGHEWYALSLAMHDNAGGAYAEIQEDRRLDPYSAPILADQCEIGYLSRDFDRALSACTEAIQLVPTLLSAHWTRLDIYEQTARSADAFHEYSTICAISRWTPCLIVKEAGLLRNPDRGDLTTLWRAEVQALERRPSDATPPVRMAQDYARLGNQEAALVTLDRLVGTSDLDGLFAYSDPAFERMRLDPRFRAFYFRVLSPRGAPPTPSLGR